MTVHRLPLMSPADASALLADLGYRETMSFAEVRAIGETLSPAGRKAFLDALRISARAASREADALEAEVGQRRERERQTKPPILTATGPDGRFTVTGQCAKALAALATAGPRGVTALEVNSWAYRLGAYVHTLRHRHGLAIETVPELHEGGWHGRYVLRSPVAFEGGGDG